MSPYVFIQKVVDTITYRFKKQVICNVRTVDGAALFGFAPWLRLFVNVKVAKVVVFVEVRLILQLGDVIDPTKVTGLATNLFVGPRRLRPQPPDHFFESIAQFVVGTINRQMEVKQLVRPTFEDWNDGDLETIGAASASVLHTKQLLIQPAQKVAQVFLGRLLCQLMRPAVVVTN